MLPTTNSTSANITPFIPYYIILLPSSIESPYFKGENITLFLEKWDFLYYNYRLTKKEKFKRLFQYIDIIYQDQIKAMPKYKTVVTAKDNIRIKGKALYKFLCKFYKNKDQDAVKISRDFLRTIIK